MTWKTKFNKKYKQPADQSNSLTKIAKLTGIPRGRIQRIYNKGVGAYKTNPSSVRPNVKSKEQWAYARVYSAVMGGKASKVDKNELEGKKKKNNILNASISARQKP
tara:strand:- start:8650 stop:8967 length:318 start_codon:yes stop_codon:yes gene_type:complete